MENEIRKGGWIQTYTGKMFYPLDPRPEDICIQGKDIICQKPSGNSRAHKGRDQEAARAPA